MASGTTIAPRRILIGQILHEAHGFTPLHTPLTSFAIETGEAVVNQNSAADSVLGGIIRVANREGWELIPTIAARASPGGRVTDVAYAHIKAHIMAGARRGGFDAIALCLHGCMQTETLDSAEADLLGSLRQVVGPHMPIVAGFDLHAHANGGALAYLNFATAYKTNPHADAGLTGERVGTVLAEIMDSGLIPVGAMVSVPMLTRGNDETSAGPLLRLHTKARDTIAKNPDLLDASIFNVNPFIDGKGVGQTALVYARNERGRAAASQLARDLANGLWAARDEFQHELPTLFVTLAYATGRLILGDFGDRVLAGGPGDSLYLVDELRKLRPDWRIVAPLTDGAAVDNCSAAGIGAQVTLKLGGGHTANGRSLTLTGVVANLGDGSYRNRGAFMRGATLRIGPFAVLEGHNFSLLLTKEPLMSQDPGCFLDCGIDLTNTNVIVAKSGYHFKLAFSEFGVCVCVATPGLTTYNPSAFSFAKARPLFPLDDFPFAAKVIRVGPQPSRSPSLPSSKGGFGDALA